MKKMTIILSIAMGTFFISCNNNSTSKNETITHEKHHLNGNTETIKLNNGEKWEVNKEMKPYITKGAELVTAFIQNKESDYKKLAKELKSENNQLIQSCTMDGKSHDELHKWLHPHLELVDKLAKTTDSTKANELVQQLEQSYQNYHNYFN